LFLLLQAALLDCPFIDPFPFSENGFVAPEVDVGGCDVVQTLMVALVVVVVAKGPDLAFEIAGQIVVLEQDTVLHSLVPAFNFALGLWMEWRAADVLHVLLAQPFGQVTRDVARAVIAEQTRLVAHDGLVAARCRQRQFDRVCHVLSAHVCAKLPGNDVAAVAVQDRAEIIPASTNDLEVSEVSLSHLVDSGGLVRELFRRFDHHVIRRSDQVGCFKNAVS